MNVPESFELHIADGIAQIVLSRPEAYNALTFEVYRELTQCFIELEAEDRVRVVILTGRGKAFCSGGDVKDIIGALLHAEEARLLQFTRMTCELVWSMRTCSKPIIACLNGVTAGAGAILAMASDFRIAADTARIAFLFVRVGLSGADMGACYVLPKIVGLDKGNRIVDDRRLHFGRRSPPNRPLQSSRSGRRVIRCRGRTGHQTRDRTGKRARHHQTADQCRNVCRV